MLPVRIFYASTISLFNYSSVLGLEAPKLNELTYRQDGEKGQSYEKLVSCDLQKDRRHLQHCTRSLRQRGTGRGTLQEV